jgi:hypothetical protein
MTDAATPKKRGSCPHCGKPAGLRWWNLLPSSDRRRLLKCPSCGGTFDLSDGAKVASMLGGFLGMGPAILLLGRITAAGHGSKPSIILGTLVVAGGFAFGSMLVTWISLRLVPKR